MIADDEHLARETIKHLLKNENDILDVVEAENGNEALELANSQKFDLIFLDIQMPGMSGIEVAEKLKEEAVIIFATAYDQYAIGAFELNAIDYLLKPFDDERFFKSLEKARQQIVNRRTTNVKDVKALIQLLVNENEQTFKSRLIVKDPGRIRLIEINNIEYILGAGNYADLHLNDNSHILHRETLTSLEQQLNPLEFIRIHRSTIVKRSCVKELKPNDNGDYTVIMKSGEQLTLSRRNKDKLNELMNAY